MSDLNDSEVTYSFKDDGVDAIRDGEVIASGADVQEAETKAHEASKTASAAQTEKVSSRRTATHVTTPNGLKGTILGRTPGIWGEEITVRFANGHIASLPTASSSGFTFSTAEDEENNSLGRIATIVATSVADDTATLSARVETLHGVRAQASKIASTLGHDDLVRLDGYIALARSEQDEIQSVLAARDSQVEDEAYTPYVPPKRSFDESWLDRVASEEVAETVRDHESEVVAFVSSLTDDTIADGSTTAQVVYDKFASEVDDDEALDGIIESAEGTRVAVQAQRREARREAKVASDKASLEAPDESLFW